MVFQKKSGKPTKVLQVKQKPKKVMEEEEDSDMDLMAATDSGEDDSSEDEMPVKNGSETTDKRVSFQLPGKGTPAKTPKSQFEAKRQLTPSVKKNTPLKGMGAKKHQIDDDDDEDDDDDMDDDFGMESGDDEGDDVTDDEEDDEEEEDDDDEPPPKAKKGQNPKGVKSEQPTPKKAQLPKAGLSPKNAQSPKAEAKSPKLKSPALEMDLQAKREKNKRSLYIGKLPHDTSKEELHKLSPDIVEVNMPDTRKGTKTRFAFLLFKSEAKAEANLPILQSKKFRGQPVSVDFCAEKSQNESVRESLANKETEQDLKKLFVGGLPVDATIDQVAKFFPQAFQIVVNASPAFRTATANFHTEELAAEAMARHPKVTINGKEIALTYSIKHKNKHAKRQAKKLQAKQKRPSEGGSGQQPPAKKFKKEIKAEESSEDEE